MSVQGASVELELLRQIGANVDRISKESAADRITLNDIDRRLIRFEANRLESEVVAVKETMHDLAAKIDALESAEDKREGAVTLASWLSKNMPWIFALSAAIAALIGIDKFGGMK
jgi:replicative DNA helicase